MTDYTVNMFEVNRVFKASDKPMPLRSFKVQARNNAQAKATLTDRLRREGRQVRAMNFGVGNSFVVYVIKG